MKDIRLGIPYLIVWALYVALGWAGVQYVHLEPANISVVWLPAGIALSALLLLGWRGLIPVFLGALVVQTAFAGYPAWYHAAIAVGVQTVQPALAYLLVRHLPFDDMLHDIRAYLRFMGWGALMPPLLTTWVFVGNLHLAGVYVHTDLASWLRLTATSSLGDALGVLLIVPAFAAIRQVRWSQVPSRSWRDGLLLTALFIGVLVFMNMHKEIRPVAVLFPLALIALRLRMAGATVGVLATTGIVLTGTALGFGPLAGLPMELRYINMVSFVLSVGLTIHLIAIARESLRVANEQLEARVAERTRQLSESETRLAEMNHAKDRLMSIIAHDLRSPLSGILGVAGFMEQDARNGDFSEIPQHAALLSRSARQTLDLLHNLLDWSAARSGGMRFEPVETDLDRSVRDALGAALETAAVKRVELDVDVPAGLLVRLDRHMFSTILRNLASNAIKYTRPGGKVRVRGEARAEGGFRLSVQDSGIGMSREVLDSLFGGQEVRTTPGTDGEKGSGLGLALCSDFVRRHSGTIRADSNPGAVTTFTLEFPP